MVLRAMSPFRYTGPLTGLTLASDQEGADRPEVLLVPGAVVTLPPDHPVVRTLLALGRLTPMPSAPLSPATTGGGADAGTDAAPARPTPRPTRASA